MLTEKDKREYAESLLRYAREDCDETIDQYLAYEDWVIVDEDDHLAHWDNWKYDFVVFGDPDEVDEEIKGSTDRRMIFRDWAKEHGVDVIARELEKELDGEEEDQE